jgi:hypothetical protein
MDKTTLTTASLIAILGAPFLGSASDLASNTMVRLALLLYLLYSIHVSELTGLLGLLAVVSIISERNYRTITGIPSRGHIPMKRDSLFENAAAHSLPSAHGIQEDADAAEYKDNNPRLSPAPRGTASAKFYMDNKLAV